MWAVAYGNYEPAEVDELYDNEAAAQQHAQVLGQPWHVERWPVRSGPVSSGAVGEDGAGDPSASAARPAPTGS